METLLEPKHPWAEAKRGCGAHDHSENSGFRIAVFEIISSVLDAGMFLCFTVASRLRLSLTKDCEERRH